MKTGLFAASAVALLQLAAAQPHGHRHMHARDVSTTTVYEPEVIVYVDTNGHTVSVETKGVAIATSSSSSSSTSSVSSTPTPSTSSVATTASPVAAFVKSSSAPPPPPPPSTTAKPTSSAAPPPPPAPSPSAPASSGGNSGSVSFSTIKGATYSPYNPDGTCRSSSQVSGDLAAIAGQGFQAIRLYGVDCSQVANAVPAARANGLKVIAGVFNIGSVTSDLGSMSSQLNGDFSDIIAVTIYNEPMNNGQLGASDVAAAIGQAKGYLKSTSFSGVVSSVDTYNQLLNPANSAVISASDIVTANCHMFFDTQVAPSNAASAVKSNCIQPLQAISGGKPVLITESGWASGGQMNDGSTSQYANPSSQATAMGQLKGMPGVFAFSYMSTAWHKTPNSVENYFGFNN